MTDIDERRAKALCKIKCSLFACTQGNCSYWHDWLDEAKAIREADEAAGMVLVPKDPTEAMLDVVSWWPGPWTEEGLLDNWYAMIAAAAENNDDR